MKAPIAKQIPHKLTTHQDTRIDPYYWLNDKENQEVIDYLEAENKYTEHHMSDSKEAVDSLYKEMIGRIKETDLTVPEKDSGYFYYRRTEEGKEYGIYCRKKDEPNAAEEIILDSNVLAEAYEYFSLHELEVSPNDQLLAYSIDTDGSERHELFIKDLRTGEIIDATVKDASGDMVWANDNKTYFYSRLDDSMRPYQLWRREIGSAEKKDVLVFQEEDERFFLHPSKTKSEDYLLIYLESKITTEVHYLNANLPKENFELFAERKNGVEYSLAHHGDRFYILTDLDKAINFKLMSCMVGMTDWAHWKEVYPYNPDVKLTGLEDFENYLVIYGRKDGLKSIHAYEYKAKELYQIKFPQPISTYHPGENPEYKTNLLRFTYSSLSTPRRVIDYDLSKQTFTIKKEYEVLGGYDKDRYEETRILAKGEDGVDIPIIMVHKKGLKLDGSNPCLLYAYGSYGISIDPNFSSIRFSLIDRGFIFAIAHIRGGGEMGRFWYEDGKFHNKKNTFSDYITCAKFLCDNKYTKASKLVAEGGSAGGLLMGSVANMAPEQFKLVCAHVPFVDVVTTMLDESLPLTVIEYEEWGNPNKKEFYKTMLSYSPYDNVEAKDYPNLLITAGLNDPRVSYWEPAKWCAKLRATKTDNNVLVLKTNMGAGHQGQSGRYGFIKEKAFIYAFILKTLDVPV